MTDEAVFEIPEDNPQVVDTLALYSDPFLNVEEAVTTYKKLVEFVRKVLSPGTDYGIIPGTPKPSMYKPGAEKMRRFFNLQTQTRLSDKVEQWDVSAGVHAFPLFSYTYITEVRDVNNNLLATSEGNCNSYETKYHWRWVDAPPAWMTPVEIDALQVEDATVGEFAFAIDKKETTGQYGKPEEYWQEWEKAIADGTAVATTRQTRKGKTLDAWERPGVRYRVPNENIFDQINTLMKMSQKRSFVGAILLATGASEFFTQDLEDYAKHLDQEQISIRTFVPEKETAARQLIAYISSKGIPQSGEYIKSVLEEHEIKFTLDSWGEIIEVLDEAMNKGWEL
jgi:hypothetical protein